MASNKLFLLFTSVALMSQTSTSLSSTTASPAQASTELGPSSSNTIATDDLSPTSPTGFSSAVTSKVSSSADGSSMQTVSTSPTYAQTSPSAKITQEATESASNDPTGSEQSTGVTSKATETTSMSDDTTSGENTETSSTSVHSTFGESIETTSISADTTSGASIGTTSSSQLSTSGERIETTMGERIETTMGERIETTSTRLSADTTSGRSIETASTSDDTTGKSDRTTPSVADTTSFTFGTTISVMTSSDTDAAETSPTSEKSVIMSTSAVTDSDRTTETTSLRDDTTSGIAETFSTLSVMTSTGSNDTRTTTVISEITSTEAVTSAVTTNVISTISSSTRVPTLPPDSVTPPSVTQQVSLNFAIVYDASDVGAGGRQERRPTRRRLLQEDPDKDVLENNLRDLYRNGTDGFLDVVVTETPQNCSNAEYKVTYDGGTLTSACTSSAGCQLKTQIETYVQDKISAVGKYGECVVNEQQTKDEMKAILNEKEQTLGNPCLLSPNLCASVGKEYTCRYDSGQRLLFCYNLCANTCGGGACYADHQDNLGYEGRAVCICPAFKYLANDNRCYDRCDTFSFLGEDDQCHSWWVVLGPLIGVAMVAIILVVALVKSRRQLKADKMKQQLYDRLNKEVDNPLFAFGTNNVDVRDEKKTSSLQSSSFKDGRQVSVEEPAITINRVEEPRAPVNTSHYSASPSTNGAVGHHRSQNNSISDSLDVKDRQPLLGTTSQSKSRRPNVGYDQLPLEGTAEIQMDTTQL